MELPVIAAAALIVLLGALLQGLAAFGFALFAVPLLLRIGLPLPVALVTVAVSNAVQTLAGAHHLRREVPWRKVGRSIPFRLLGLLLGIAALRTLAAASTVSIRFWVGAVTLLLVAALAVARPRPRPRLPAAWDAAAFSLSGFTGGLVSMGGPPLVLWTMAHDWPAVTIRAFLFAAFLSMVPPQLLLLYGSFPDAARQGFALGAGLAPLAYAGTLLGLRIGNRFSKRRLQALTYALLVFVALNAMLPQLRAWATGGRRAQGGGAPVISNQ